MLPASPLNTQSGRAEQERKAAGAAHQENLTEIGGALESFPLGACVAIYGKVHKREGPLLHQKRSLAVIEPALV